MPLGDLLLSREGLLSGDKSFWGRDLLLCGDFFSTDRDRERLKFSTSLDSSICISLLFASATFGDPGGDLLG